MQRINAECYKQIVGAYERMASVGYRPSAPSDGCGNITVPIEELNLQREADQYSEEWWKSEDELSFFVGCCSFETRAATIFAVEAARCMTAGMADVALKLLRLAVDHLEGLKN